MSHTRTEAIAVRTTRKLLLATDLSCRCDRAFARAALLAERWHARLLAIHVLEHAAEVGDRRASDLPSWRRAPDRQAWAEGQLRGDLLEHAPGAGVIIATGEPGPAIVRAAARHEVDLIITGMTRSEAFDRLLAGATVSSLIRNASAPVLVVKNRPRDDYRRIVVTTDFSEVSRSALDATLRLFSDSDVVLFHAFQMPGRGIVHNDRSIMEFRQMLEPQVRACLLDCALRRNYDATRVEVIVEHGDLGWLLRDYVRANQVDLVVSGTHGLAVLVELLIGSVAKQLLDTVPCDMMIVRQTQGA